MVPNSVGRKPHKTPPKSSNAMKAGTVAIRLMRPGQEGETRDHAFPGLEQS